MKRLGWFCLEWVMQGIGIGIGLCIALPLAEAVRAALI